VDRPVENDADARTDVRIAALSAEVSRLRQERCTAEEQLRVAERARDLALADMEAHEERLTRVVALCDMAEWATETAGGGPPAVQVDEIRRALRVERPRT
jgi:hypothetical protein